MTELAVNDSTYTSTWSLIISIGVLLLSIKFPILFLINGIFTLAFGIYFVISTNAEKAKIDEIDKTGILGNFLYGYYIFIAWFMVIFGGVSILIYFIILFINRGKNSSKNLVRYNI
jgi:hypothetical protein